jgi:hypothetical protein
MDSTPSSMLDGLDFEARLADITRRIDAYALAPSPAGLTAPDADTGEQWQAAQVWAHMAEFIGYWQDQIESVVGQYAGEPVPFGRTKTDPGRIAAIEVGRHEPVAELVERTRTALAGFRRYLAELGSAQRNAVGLHETRGALDVEAIVERFIVSHLEEHLDQLDELQRADQAPA